jgi:hypothetical protein
VDNTRFLSSSSEIAVGSRLLEPGGPVSFTKNVVASPQKTHNPQRLAAANQQFAQPHMK